MSRLVGFKIEPILKRQAALLWARASRRARQANEANIVFI